MNLLYIYIFNFIINIMKNYKSLLLIFFLITSFYAQAQKNNSTILTDKIDYEYFQSSLEYLSSDDLKGRDTGSEEYAIAAEFVSEKFKALGLNPLGDNNSYFQKVPLIKKSLIKSSVRFNIEGIKNKVIGQYGKNISLIINPEYNKIDEKQELVFIGYGNIIPDKKINDYKGLDVKGKTVIVVMGAPKSLKDYNGWDPFIKVRNAMMNGVGGVIIIFPNSLFQNKIFEQMHGYLDIPMVSISDSSFGKSILAFDLKIGALAKKSFVKDVFKVSNLNLNKELKKISKGEFASKELNATISCSYQVKEENNDCKNVVGFLPGTDELLKNEYVVVGAHLDHVGVGQVVKRDSIYNGMWDNATGSAAVLTMAKTYTKLDDKPKRSIIFICYTGEEKGLLGSNYYANKNNIANGRIVANVNIDMLGGLFLTKDIIPMGYSHSNLSEAVDYSANQLNLIIDDNKQEEYEYMMRSDQASFINVGVPALNIANGYTAVDSKIKAKKEIDKWMEKYYHSPFDDLNQEYSKETFLLALKYNFLTTYYITHVMDDIKWNEHSWIFKKYILGE